MEDGAPVAALFTLTEAERTVSVTLRELGLTGGYQLYDLWKHAVVGTVTEDGPIAVTLAPTASAVFRLI